MATPNSSNSSLGSVPPSMVHASLRAGSKVRVTQQVPRAQGDLKATVEGSVVKYEQSQTGSWYTHGKNDRLWLDRLVLRRDDGEIVYLNLDQYSLVEAV